MDKEIRFDGRVAIVTGAGSGLGRTYALELAGRGAQVVVNDLGGARDGSGTGCSAPADQVAAEIRAKGGEAVANYDTVSTVEGGENIVRTAVEAYGKVDILINNAGILRDKSFVNMEPEIWDQVIAVHLRGAYCVTRPAWKVMKENQYGRIIVTTSRSGLNGLFGQSNYGAAKMGVVGMMNTLRFEGKKYNIQINCLAPIALSRLTEGVFPKEQEESLTPDKVTPIVTYLVSEQCRESGSIYLAGGGNYGRIAIVTGPGVTLGGDNTAITAEDIRENWEKINSIEGAREGR